MTTVNTTTTPKTGNPSPLIRQQAIESALEDALHFIRTGPPWPLAVSGHGAYTARSEHVEAGKC